MKNKDDLVLAIVAAIMIVVSAYLVSRDKIFSMTMFTVVFMGLIIVIRLEEIEKQIKDNNPL